MATRGFRKLVDVPAATIDQAIESTQKLRVALRQLRIRYQMFQHRRPEIGTLNPWSFVRVFVLGRDLGSARTVLERVKKGEL